MAKKEEDLITAYVEAILHEKAGHAWRRRVSDEETLRRRQAVNEVQQKLKVALDEKDAQLAKVLAERDAAQTAVTTLHTYCTQQAEYLSNGTFTRQISDLARAGYGSAVKHAVEHDEYEAREAGQHLKSQADSALVHVGIGAAGYTEITLSVTGAADCHTVGVTDTSTTIPVAVLPTAGGPTTPASWRSTDPREHYNKRGRIVVWLDESEILPADVDTKENWCVFFHISHMDGHYSENKRDQSLGANDEWPLGWKWVPAPVE